MSLFRFGFKHAGEVNKGNSEKTDEVDQESNKGGEQTENQAAGAYSKQATPQDKYEEKRKRVAVGLEKNGLRSFHGCNTRKNRVRCSAKCATIFQI